MKINNRPFQIFDVKGFTLIELLIGLGLFAVIGSIIYSTFASGIRLSRTFDAENEVYREVRMTFELMSMDLENIKPYDFTGSYPEKFAFEGQANELTFLSFDDHKFKFFNYALEKPTDSRIYQTVIGGRYAKNVSTTLVNQLNQKINYLIREEREFFDALKENPEIRPEFEIISSHVAEGSLKFSYGFFENKDAQELSWRNDWNLHYLPRVVRIELDYMIEEKGSKDSQKIQHFTKDILIPGAKGYKVES